MATLPRAAPPVQISAKNSNSERLLYIDGLRGIACIVMFQTHCYDAWLSPSARAGRFFGWSQFLGTLAAPLFLFLVGISLALAIGRMASRGRTPGEIGSATVRRGAAIVGLGLLLRVQEFLLGWPHAPWTDLFRVDVLNIIGVSIILIGLSSWGIAGRGRMLIVGCASAIVISMVTPVIWNAWRPQALPWFLESYIDGVHTYGIPQPWLFPIFPWTALCFAGLAVGAVVFDKPGEQRQSHVMAWLALAGVAAFFLALWFDGLPVKVYAVYDFWHTSPNFLLARVGVLMLIMSGCYWWWRAAAGNWLSAALVRLGQASLLVYWVHLEFVYGRFSILPKGKTGVLAASAGLLIISAAMVLLASGRNRLSRMGAKMRTSFSLRKPPAVGTSTRD